MDGKCECGYDENAKPDSSGGGSVNGGSNCKSEVGSTLAMALLPAIFTIFKKRRK